MKMNAITIDKKLVGTDQPCFIIAEAGVNHNGSLKLAKKLVDTATTAKADAVKFQTFKADLVVTKKADLAYYAERNIGQKISQLDMLKNVELTYNDFATIKQYCDKKNIIFLSTPHSFDAIDFLDDLVPAYKFGSGDLTNIPALSYAARKCKPMILGTGMSTIQEIKSAVKVIKAERNEQIIALHCTTNYPCPIEEANLQAMKTMQKELDCVIGYSDHTMGNLASTLAVALGACIIEKHFTLNRDLPGPDHKASMEPGELKKFVQEIRKTEEILGSSDKKPTESEKQIMKYVRKSIVANQDIPKSSIITTEMLSIKRPGLGLNPSKLENIIGKKAKQNITKDELLQLEMVE